MHMLGMLKILNSGRREGVLGLGWVRKGALGEKSLKSTDLTNEK